MRPRTTLFLVAASVIAACSGSGVTVDLGGGALATGGAGSAGSNAAAGSAAVVAIAGGLPDPVTCTPGVTTSVSGTVYDPAGKVPLYNAVVYVPTNEKLPAFSSTVECERCTDPVATKAVALTDASGHFVLDGVPPGKDVKLVVQLGKWRRMISIPVVRECENTALTDKSLTRLPRNQAEGDIPKIALSTGHSDALECLLRKIGIDDSEFTTDAGKGRVNMFVGCIDDSGKEFGADKFSTKLGGGGFPSTNRLFDANELDDYDAVIFSCEGHRCESIQTDTNVAKLVAYEDRGGRVFLDHDHYNWIKNSKAPIHEAAVFKSSKATIASPLPAKIDTAGFPKGEAFADWLLNVSASSRRGELDIYSARSSSTDIHFQRARSWIYSQYLDENDDGKQVLNNHYFYFTIGTPVSKVDDAPPPEACGRVVFTDLHVSAQGVSPDFSRETTPFPEGCISRDLSPQEKALEFMLFDLTSCVQMDSAMPMPPPPPPK